LCIIGAGAAGLFASIFAGREVRSSGHRLFMRAFDGAPKLGAKILVAGGGRCNVTHHVVDELQYAGSSRNAIKKVLRRFDVKETVEFFQELGVELKQEETGKLFPVTDRAATVLHALLDEVKRVGVLLQHPERVHSISRESDLFTITTSFGTYRAHRVILATGGMALPKSGSDGAGYALARSLGHSVTPAVFPSLVPLKLEPGHFLLELSGISIPATLQLASATGRKLTAFTNSVLFTHFGLSGPAVLDISRYHTSAMLEAAGTPAPQLLLNCLPSQTPESLDAALTSLGRKSIGAFMADLLPDRLGRALASHSGVVPSTPGHALTREQRRSLVHSCTSLRLPITGDRGFTFAEATAGGVPLSEVHLETMESRICPGLHLCGEVLDVDGRVGGFNFQWAWSSGFVAGKGAAQALILDEEARTLSP
jgi:predicted Rossmann fold flavoprotein